MPRSKNLVFLTASMIIFGTNGLLVARISLPSAQIVLLRTFFGFLFLLAVVAARRSFSFAELKSDLVPATVGGVALGLNWVLLFGAYRYAGVSISTLVYYCGPMIAIILSPIVFKERLTANKLIAVIAVAAGMLCISGNVSSGSDMQTGLLMGAGAAALYALIIIVTKRITHMSGLNCSAYELFISFIVMVLYLLVSGVKLPVIPAADDTVNVLIIGFVNTGLAYYMYFSALQKLPAQTSALISYIEPLTALIVSAAFLGEKLGAVQLLGAVLILGGGYIGEYIICSLFFPAQMAIAYPIAVTIGNLVDPPATMINSAGDYVVSFLVARFTEGKDWLERAQREKAAH